MKISATKGIQVIIEYNEASIIGITWRVNRELSGEFELTCFNKKTTKGEGTGWLHVTFN
jgi:hypothetical protein